MRVLVTGGRDYKDKDKVWHELDLLKERSSTPIVIIEGGATGADAFAAEWARLQGDDPDEYPAAWKQYGKAAGAIRNQQMLDEGKPDVVFAFQGGNGTKDMVVRAIKAGVRVVGVL